MPEKLLSYIKIFEDWGAAYGFAWGMLLAIVFFVVFYISIRTIKQVGKNTQRNFQFLKSGLDDRDIVMAERSQKIVATLNDLRGILKQGEQWEATSKNAEEQRENFEQLLVAVEESAKTIKNAVEESAKAIKNDVTEQEMYLHDRFAALANDNKANSNISPETLSEIIQKIAQMEERLEDVINKRLSGLDYMEGLDEKVSSLTVSRMEENINPKINRLEARLEDIMNNRLSGSLEHIEGLSEKISSFSAVQLEMDKISKNVTQLSRFLSVNGVATDAVDRKRLGDLLAQSLPADFYQLESTLQNGSLASALLRLPEPNSAVVIDAELSLDKFFESLDGEADDSVRAQAREDFHKTTVERINFVADNLIAPPETGDSAFLFVPTEAAFAEIQAHHHEAVELAIQRRIWLVSPTTVIAIINTARAAVRDYQAQQQLEKIRETAADILKEAQIFENRIVEIGDHVNSAWRSVQRAETAGSRLLGRVREASINIEKDGGS